MNKIRFGAVPCALLCSAVFASSAQAVVGVTPMVMATGAGDLQLFDPSRPVAVDNPFTVDTGLTTTELEQVRTLVSVAISGTIASNIRLTRVIYIKGGQLFNVTLPGTNHAPVRFSSITDACDFSPREDFSNVNNSWVEVQRLGADGNCYSQDDVRTAVKITAPVTVNGVSPPGMSRFDTIIAANGAISGFLSVEGGATKVVKHRDANFANQVTIKTLANGNAERYEKIASQLFLKLTPAGQTLPQLFRYDEAANGLTMAGPLYHFTIDIDYGCVDNGTNDGSNFYFCDGNNVFRVPLTATSETDAHLITVLPGGLRPNQLRTAPTGTRLVFDTTSSGGASNGVYSVARDADNVAPTLLKGSNPQQGVFAQFSAVANEFVYINVSNFVTRTVSAVRVNADGTSPATTPSSYWAGATVPSTFDFSASSGPDTQPIFMIKATRSGTSDTLRLFAANTGNANRTLGTVNNVFTGGGPAVFGGNFGRYIPLIANTDPGTHVPNADVYVADVQTDNSLVPVLTTPDNDHIYFGGN